MTAPVWLDAAMLLRIATPANANGDYVIIGDRSGLVEHMSLRVVQLCDARVASRIPGIVSRASVKTAAPVSRWALRMPTRLEPDKLLGCLRASVERVLG